RSEPSVQLSAGDRVDAAAMIADADSSRDPSLPRDPELALGDVRSVDLVLDRVFLDELRGPAARLVGAALVLEDADADELVVPQLHQLVRVKAGMAWTPGTKVPSMRPM